MRLFGKRRKVEKSTPGRRHSAVERPAADVPVPVWRRNRTITDRSTVPEVSERARVHHLRSLRRKVGMVLGVTVLALVFVAVVISQFTSSVQISVTDTSMVERPDHELYKGFLNDYYKRYPLERFRFLVDQERLLAWLQDSAPEVLGITPKGVASLGVAKYEIKFRQPLVSWRVGEDQYYVDTKGVTFDKNYYEAPSVSVLDESGARVQEGSAIASSRLLSFMGRAVDLAAKNGVKVKQVEIPSQSMRQIYLHGEGVPVVRMSVDRGVEYQIVDMRRTLEFLSSRGETPGYIDVRTSGRVFYQ